MAHNRDRLNTVPPTDTQADLYFVLSRKQSQEAEAIQHEIDSIHNEKANVPSTDDDPSALNEFAMPFTQQLNEVTYRVFQQCMFTCSRSRPNSMRHTNTYVLTDWRMPSYVMAKFMLSTASGLFIGFSFFNANSSLQGMQNVLYGLFMVSSIFSTIVQQIMPLFVTQRSLYEVRERPSKAYSWKAFLFANIVVEWPYQLIASILVFATFYCKQEPPSSIVKTNANLEIPRSDRRYPIFREARLSPGAVHRLLHLRVDLRTHVHCCNARCSNGRRYRNAAVCDDSHLQRRHAVSDSAPRLLDLHVSGLTIYILGRRHGGRHALRPRGPVLFGRDEHLQSS